MNPAHPVAASPFSILYSDELSTGFLESCKKVSKSMTIDELAARIFRASALSMLYIPTLYPAIKYFLPIVLTAYIYPLDLLSTLVEPIQDSGFMEIIGSAIQITSFSINLIGFGFWASIWFRKELTGAINWVEMLSLSDEQNQINSEKPVALMCVAKMDVQGAITRIARTYLEEIKKISEFNDIVIVRVGEIADINKAKASLLEKGKNIDLIILAAHGDKDIIQLGWDAQITPANILNLDLSGLKENTPLCLFSCSTGKECSVGVDNIAQKIQNVACSTFTVYAPKEPPTRLEFINQDNKKSFKFYNSLGNDITFIARKE